MKFPNNGIVLHFYNFMYVFCFICSIIAIKIISNLNLHHPLFESDLTLEFNVSFYFAFTLLVSTALKPVHY